METKEVFLTDLFNEKELAAYQEFCKKHRRCNFSSTIGGKISVIVTGTGLGYCFECRCNQCGEIKDITDSSSW